jgi:hypothetical protein
MRGGDFELLCLATRWNLQIAVLTKNQLSMFTRINFMPKPDNELPLQMCLLFFEEPTPGYGHYDGSQTVDQDITIYMSTFACPYLLVTDHIVIDQNYSVAFPGHPLLQATHAFQCHHPRPITHIPSPPLSTNRPHSQPQAPSPHKNVTKVLRRVPASLRRHRPPLPNLSPLQLLLCPQLLPALHAFQCPSVSPQPPTLSSPLSTRRLHSASRASSPQRLSEGYQQVSNSCFSQTSRCSNFYGSLHSFFWCRTSCRARP